MGVTASNRDGVTVLTLDRPPVNAMDLELLEQLVDRLDAVAASPPAALVIEGAGGSFSAGLDLKKVPAYGPADQRKVVAAINAMVLASYPLPCPVVAAVTGHAIAGGFILAICADYRVASLDGRYGLTEVKVGVPYPAAAIGVVRAELPPHAARRLALGNQLVGAAECVELGVFDEALPAGDVTERAVAVAKELAGFPAPVYARTKGELRARASDDMRAAVEAEPLAGTTSRA